MSIVDDAIAQIIADKNAAIKEAALWKAEVEKYQSVRRQQELLGLFNRDNHAIRVRWVNALRKIIDKRMPTNKMGSPLTTDVDVLLATDEERLEALEIISKK